MRRELPVLPSPPPIAATGVQQTSPNAETVDALEGWLAEALERLEHLPDEQTRTEVFALLDGIDLLHRRALARLLELVGRSPDSTLAAELARDPVVGRLLEMYDLSQPDERRQVEAALSEADAYVRSHGGSMELLGVEEGRVRIRLSGSCGRCPGSSVTLARVVEDALRSGYPGFTELIAEEPTAAAPVGREAGRVPLRQPRWVRVAAMDELGTATVAVRRVEGTSLLLARLGNEAYAYRDGCPSGSPLTLLMGSVDGVTLVCPWHGCRYDLRTGRREDAAGRLDVVPVAVRSGEILVALGTEEVAAA